MDIKKSILSVAICLAATAATATELEVSFHYPDSFAESGDYDMARYIVGFYRQLETSNIIYANNGVDITLVPAYVHGLTFEYTTEWNMSGDYDESSDNTDALRIAGQWTDSQTPHVDIHLAMSLSNTTLGSASSNTVENYELGYDWFGHRRAIGISSSVLLSSSSNKGHNSLLAHEVGHSVGLSHSEAEAVTDWPDAIDQVGYPTTCDNGDLSLMYYSAKDIAVSNTKISGAVDCLGDGNANSVAFLNKYAPQFASVVSNVNSRTLTLSVSENADESQFTFQVTRTKEQANAATGMLYIAGGNSANNENTPVDPIEISFAAGSLVSETINVGFDIIHTLFEIADDSEASTYAVAIMDNEVQGDYTDLLDVNTAWDGSDDGGTSTGGGGEGSSSGGGGSASVAFLLLMFSGLLLRMKPQTKELKVKRS